MSRRISPVVVALLFLALAALACNAPTGGTPPPSLPTTPPEATTAAPPAPTDTPEQAAASPTPSPPLATDTPVPDVSGEGGCTLNAAYVADVTIPDDTEVNPGDTFHKVWRVRNSGTCDWEEGTKLVFVSGEQMGTTTSVNVPVVPTGGTADIAVDMQAPATPGTYRSTWQLQSPEGVFFGSQIYAQIVVPEQATATPTPEPPTATPTATPTEEAPPPGPPDLVITSMDVDTDTPRQGVPLHIIATIRNQGESTAENFHWAWRVCVHEGCEYTEAPGTYTLGPGEETTVQMEYTFQGYAEYTTEGWVDSREEVAESDEDNNTHLLIFTVSPAQPDLIIQSITFDPDPPVADQEVLVRVVVVNQGLGDVQYPFTVQWWGGVNFPEPSCEWTAAPLPHTYSASLNCSFTYSSWYGSITTRAVADVNDEIVEADEDNNTLDLNISVSQ